SFEPRRELVQILIPWRPLPGPPGPQHGVAQTRILGPLSHRKRRGLHDPLNHFGYLISGVRHYRRTPKISVCKIVDNGEDVPDTVDINRRAPALPARRFGRPLSTTSVMRWGVGGQYTSPARMAQESRRLPHDRSIEPPTHGEAVRTAQPAAR